MSRRHLIFTRQIQQMHHAGGEPSPHQMSLEKKINSIARQYNLNIRRTALTIPVIIHAIVQFETRNIISPGWSRDVLQAFGKLPEIQDAIRQKAQQVIGGNGKDGKAEGTTSVPLSGTGEHAASDEERSLLEQLGFPPYARGSRFCPTTPQLEQWARLSQEAHQTRGGFSRLLRQIGYPMNSGVYWDKRARALGITPDESAGTHTESAEPPVLSAEEPEPPFVPFELPELEPGESNQEPSSTTETSAELTDESSNQVDASSGAETAPVAPSREELRHMDDQLAEDFRYAHAILQDLEASCAQYRSAVQAFFAQQATPIPAATQQSVPTIEAPTPAAPPPSPTAEIPKPDPKEPPLPPVSSPTPPSALSDTDTTPLTRQQTERLGIIRMHDAISSDKPNGRSGFLTIRGLNAATLEQWRRELADAGVQMPSAVTATPPPTHHAVPLSSPPPLPTWADNSLVPTQPIPPPTAPEDDLPLPLPPLPRRTIPDAPQKTYPDPFDLNAMRVRIDANAADLSLAGCDDLVLTSSRVLREGVQRLRATLNATPAWLLEARTTLTERLEKNTLTPPEEGEWTTLDDIDYEQRTPEQRQRWNALLIKQRGIEKGTRALPYVELVQIPRLNRTEKQRALLELLAKELFGYVSEVRTASR